MSAPVAVDYRQFTDTELATARAETLAALSGDDPTEEDATRADDITAEIERRNAVTEATNARRLQLAGLEITPRARPVDRPRTEDAPPASGRTSEPENFNLREALAPAVTAYRANGMQGSMVLAEVPDLRALVTTATYPTPKQRVPGIVAPPEQMLLVADLLDQQNMTAGSIEYVRELTFTETAAEVAEGAAKPESAITFDVVAAALATIATWIPITRQAAEDDAQLEGYITGRLSYSVEKRLDNQLLSGNGTAPNIRGILNTVGIQTQAVGTDGMLVAIRKAITKGQISGYPPTGAVMHPTDWEGVELTKDLTSGQFIFTKDPTNLTAPRVWGLPLVVTVGIAAGTALVGAFRDAATLWRKGTVRVLISDSHDVNFTKNILVILAELRAQLAVYVPAAFVKVS